MLSKNRHGNPVWSESDKRIRELLTSEQTPEAERDALLAEQIELLKALKTEEDPGWQDQWHPPVETQIVRDVLCLDGLVRMNRRA